MSLGELLLKASCVRNREPGIAGQPCRDQTTVLTRPIDGPERITPPRRVDDDHCTRILAADEPEAHFDRLRRARPALLDFRLNDVAARNLDGERVQDLPRSRQELKTENTQGTKR